MPCLSAILGSSVLCLLIPIVITGCAGRPVPPGSANQGHHGQPQNQRPPAPIHQQQQASHRGGGNVQPPGGQGHNPHPHPAPQIPHGATNRGHPNNDLIQSTLRHAAGTAPRHGGQDLRQVSLPSARAQSEFWAGNEAFSHLYTPHFAIPPVHPRPAPGPQIPLLPNPGAQHHAQPHASTAGARPVTQAAHGGSHSGIQPHQQIQIPAFGTPHQAGHGGLSDVYHFHGNQPQTASGHASGSGHGHQPQPPPGQHHQAQRPPNSNPVPIAVPHAAPPLAQAHQLAPSPPLNLGQQEGNRRDAHGHQGNPALAGPGAAPRPNNHPEIAPPGAGNHGHQQPPRQVPECPVSGCNKVPVHKRNMPKHLAKIHQWSDDQVEHWKNNPQMYRAPRQPTPLPPPGPQQQEGYGAPPPGIQLEIVPSWKQKGRECPVSGCDAGFVHRYNIPRHLDEVHHWDKDQVQQWKDETYGKPKYLTGQ